MSHFIDRIKLKRDQIGPTQNASFIAWATLLIGLGGLVGGALTKSVLGTYMHVIGNTLRVGERLIELLFIVDLSNQAEANLNMYKDICITLIIVSICCIIGSLLTLVIMSSLSSKKVKLNFLFNILMVCVIIGLSVNTFYEHYKLNKNLAKSFRTHMLGSYNTSLEYKNLNKTRFKSTKDLSHNDLIDQLQRVFMCCGAVDYRDFETYKPISRNPKQKIPFACCRDTSQLDLCSQNPTTRNSFISQGCHEAILSKIESSPWFILAAIVLQDLTLIVCTIWTYIIFRTIVNDSTIEANSADTEPLKSDFSLE